MRLLHFGCGPNRLPEPWENFDREVDIGRPLSAFADGSASYVFAEHVIEHVPFLSGVCFLSECYRILEPNGVLRFAFPDVTRLTFPQDIETYLDFLRTIRKPARHAGDVYRFILTGSQHQAAWTSEVGLAAAKAVGFIDVRSVSYGTSEHHALASIDGHHKTSSVARLESTILEVTKP